jgi:hypothetical protein
MNRKNTKTCGSGIQLPRNALAKALFAEAEATPVQASLRLMSLTGLAGWGRFSAVFLGLTTCFSKSCATEGFRLPPIVLGTLGIFLPEVLLRCCVRIGISRILLSPCGFGLFSDISLPDCRPCGETILGPLRSAIRHLSHRVRWRGAAMGGVKIES